jgi:hypothetical protein
MGPEGQSEFCSTPRPPPWLGDHEPTVLSALLMEVKVPS